MTDVLERPHPLIASDRVEGTAVRRPNGERLGHIERLMIDKVTGKVSYAILSFGGFLGMGSNFLPLPWARLRYNPNPKPTNSTSTRTNCGARRRSAPTRISTGAIARRKPSCIAITASRPTGAGSDRRRESRIQRQRSAKFASRVTQRRAESFHGTCRHALRAFKMCQRDLERRVR